MTAEQCTRTISAARSKRTATRCAARRNSETFEPHFTYHGFRYVQVSGLASKPRLADSPAGRSTRRMADAGTFETSSPLITKLWRNVRWTQRDNMFGIPTDCPQRDERLGWMGDIQVFSGTSIFNADMGAFFTKWMRDVRDAQTPDGRYADFSPQPFRAQLDSMKRPGLHGRPRVGRRRSRRAMAPLAAVRRQTATASRTTTPRNAGSSSFTSTIRICCGRTIAETITATG